MSATPRLIAVDATLSPQALATLKELNPDAVIGVHIPLADKPSQAATTAPSGVLKWLIEVLRPVAVAGATIYLPPPLGAFAATFLKEGLDWADAKLSGQPAKPSWTLAEMQAERDAVAAVVPKT